MDQSALAVKRQLPRHAPGVIACAWISSKAKLCLQPDVGSCKERWLPARSWLESKWDQPNDVSLLDASTEFV